jgi:hypothetical protein
MTPSYVMGIGGTVSDQVEFSMDASFGDEENARLHMSAFRTIIEASWYIINNPRAMIEAYPDYFKPIIDELVDKGEDADYVLQEMGEALGKLFAINQRLAFMVGTELADTIGARPIDQDLMIDPIVRSNEKSKTPEEMYEEAIAIMRQNLNDNSDEGRN